MNKKRRTSLAKALPMLAEAARLIAEAKIIAAEIKEDLDDAYSNMSEGAQAGDNGQEMQGDIDEMTDALDRIDVLDIADIAKRLAELGDREEPVIAGPALTEAELDARREQRLAPWAKALIAHANARAKSAEEDLARTLGEVDPSNPRQIVIDDYQSPLRGKVLPSEQVVFPGLAIRAFVSRDGKRLEIASLDMAGIVIRPHASNTVHISTTRDY